MHLHETRINEALLSLGEEHRLGMISTEEYRSRRRTLVESWGEQEVTTSPGKLRETDSPPKTEQLTVQPDPRAPSPPSRMPLVAGALAVLALVAAGYGVWQKQKPRIAGTMADAPATLVAPEAPGLAAIRRAADAFMARNAWDPAEIDAFLVQWRALSPELRAEARGTPALRSLRHALSQNIEAESQLVPADAPPEQRTRLDSLTRFAQELDA